MRNQLQAERKRVYAINYTGDDFAPEINDGLDHKSVFAEFNRITGSLLTQSRVLGIVNESIPQDAVIVAASGSLPGIYSVSGVQPPQRYHVEYGYSCMGYEVNAALGVKMAEPRREVYALVGDGAFMMSHSELVTSIQEGRKINVLLFDNMANGCINNLQLGHGMQSFSPNSVSGINLHPGLTAPWCR